VLDLLKSSVIPGILILSILVLLAACGRTDASERLASTEDVSDASDQAEYRTGLDSLRLAQVVERASELQRLRALLIARHGEVFLEQRFNGPGLDQPVNVKSVSKSILSAVVGIAIEEQLLAGVDQPIWTFFEEYLRGEQDSRKREITIDHLLSMRSGLERTSGSNYGRWVTSPNWVRHALSRELLSEPGTARDYSTGNSHLLSAILTAATGESTWSYARSRLAEPLGITLPRWPTDPQGIFFGGNDMLISPRGLLRFGELYRNGGRLEGRQIVPAWWVRESLEPRANSRWSGDGYGYGWFSTRMGGHAVYYGWGYGGQYVFIVPTLELTVVATSDPYADGGREHRRQVQTILAELIIPAAEVGGEARAE
jgi:CubicO group peptidase (beta-lactamase class C family)